MTDQTAMTGPDLEAPSSRHQSEYLAAREEWDNRFAGQHRTVRVLAGITYLALVLAVLGIGYGIYTGARTQYLPFLVKVDELGRTEVVLPPERVEDWDPLLIRRELELFFERLRTVSPDPQVISENHRAFEKYLPAGSPAATKLRAFFQEPRNNPITRAKTETVAMEVISVNSISETTWRVEWRETTYSATSGKLTGTKRFVATAQIEFRTPTSRALLQVNPLGLFIRDIDIQEIQT